MMRKLILIPDSKLPTGWVYDDIYADANGDDGIYIYKHLTKGVVIVQFDYTSGSEKISVDSGRTILNDLKNHLSTLDAKKANEKAIEVMGNV
jgi:hypothetical protein